jgi:aspartyl protease family protein
MSGVDKGQLLLSALLLILPLSAMFARSLPIGQTVRMLLVWIGIFAAVYLIFLFRGEFGQLWQRISSDVSSATTTTSNGEIKVRKAADGHFYIDALVNGHPTRFLVDSGATITTLSMDSAAAAGVDVDQAGFPVVVDTANGAAEEWRAKIKSLSIGPISRVDFPIHVGEGLGDMNLIGMNFLETLAGWRVQGDELILLP